MISPADAALWQSRRRRALAFILVAIPVLGLILFTLRANERSFAVQTVTRGLDIQFSGSAMNAWRLEDTSVCYRRQGRLSGLAPAQPDASGCDARLFEIMHFDVLELVWPDAAQVQIARFGMNSPLEIQLLATGPTPMVVEGKALGLNSRIVVADGAWQEGSTLTMAGQVVIGRAPGPGSQFNLLGGSYAISEKVTWGSGPAVVAEGQLLSGDQVRMVEERGGGREAINVFGFIEPLASRSSGFGAMLYSPLGESALEINRFGTLDILISPSWTDRATASPVLLGFSAIVALLSGMAGIITLVRWVWNANREGIAEGVDVPEDRGPRLRSPAGPVKGRGKPVGGKG